MNNIIDNLADVAATATSLVLDHIRELATVALVVGTLVGWHAVVHHMVAEQAADAAMFDNLTRPQANVAMVTTQQQWIPPQ